MQYALSEKNFRQKSLGKTTTSYAVELQYASLLGLAKGSGRKPIFCLSFGNKSVDIRKTFFLSVTDDCPKSIVFHQLFENGARQFDSTLYDTLSSDCKNNYRLNAFTQSWRYFEHIKGKRISTS